MAFAALSRAEDYMKPSSMAVSKEKVNNPGLVAARGFNKTWLYSEEECSELLTCTRQMHSLRKDIFFLVA